MLDAILATSIPVAIIAGLLPGHPTYTLIAIVIAWAVNIMWLTTVLWIKYIINPDKGQLFLFAFAAGVMLSVGWPVTALVTFISMMIVLASDDIVKYLNKKRRPS